MKTSHNILVLLVLNISIFSTMFLTFMMAVIAPQILVPQVFLHVNSSRNLTGTIDSTGEAKMKLGFFFGCKGVIQALGSPLVGLIIDKTFPLTMILTAAVSELLATIIYSYTQVFASFFVARCFNGIGSVASLCGCFSSIPYYFKTDNNRKILSGMLQITKLLAISVSPMLGGAINQFFGQPQAFSILIPGYIFVILVCLMFIINFYRDQMKHSSVETTLVEHKISVSQNSGKQNVFSNGYAKVKLFVDPYIIITAIGVGIPNWGNMGINVTLPLYMRTKFHSQQYQQGLVFLSGIGFHLFGTLVSLFVYRRWSRYSYIFIMATLIINAIATFLLLYIDEWYLLTIPVGVNFFTIAMMEYPLFPFIATLVDKRHASNYGSAYGIAVAFHSLGSGVISFISGPFVTEFGFSYFILGISCMYLVYVPFLLFTSDYWR